MLKAKAKTKQLLLIRVVKVVELETKHKYRDWKQSVSNVAIGRLGQQDLLS